MIEVILNTGLPNFQLPFSNQCPQTMRAKGAKYYRYRPEYGRGKNDLFIH